MSLSWAIFFAFVLGVMSEPILEFIIDRVTYIHKWSCPIEGCKFTVRANRKDTIESVRINHSIHIRS